MMELYCCEKLKRRKSMFVCGKCRKEYKIEKGIPQFSQGGVYWGEITKEEMHRLYKEISKGRYWKTALKEIIDKNPRIQFPEPYSFVTDLSRANWLFLLSLGKNIRVLDIGAGMGTVSEIMSHYAKEVVAIEPVDERLQFCKQRFKQEGIKNITLLKADAFNLPFKPESFDLVIMNGVLEWVGAYGKEDPKKVQEKVLKSVLKLLKPGGNIYVGIENRLCHDHFIGHYDPHVDIRFITLMPRFLANIYSKILTGKKYGTYIYSHNGYKRLFKKTGFKEVELYNVMPDYNVPTYMVPTYVKNVYVHLMDQLADTPKSLIKRIALSIRKNFAKTGLIHHFLPAYIIFGKK